MKRIHTLKRTIALFLAMLLAATSVAFADWDSFQGDDLNNGASATGVDAKGNVITADLPNNGATTGLDVEPLIHGSRIYAFHNGGSNGPTVTAISATDGIQLWTKSVSGGTKDRVHPENVSQIATPVLSKDGKTLYGVYTYNYDTARVDAFSEKIPVGKSVTKTFIIDLPHAYNNLQIATGLSNTSWTEGDYEHSLSATATIKQGSTEVADLTGSSYENQGFSLYYGDYSGGIIPAGGYTVEMTVTNNTQDVVIWTSGGTKAFVNFWQAFKITNIDTSEPTVAELNAHGYGQASTPLTFQKNLANENGKLYFGIYDGDRAYYQYDTEHNTAKVFTPAGNDQFYNAGAVVHAGKVYFGSESGNVYIQRVDYFNETGGVEQIADGAIRSSIALEISTDSAACGYFTSLNGKLWKVALSGNTVSPIAGLSLGTEAAAAHSTATPTISGNNVYVTTYGSNPTTWAAIGTVKRVAKNFTAATPITTIYNGDGVQCSPVVYRTGAMDYVYFTTNVSDGTGYCYRVRSIGGVTPMWNAPSGNYSLQGFAVGSNYMVFGNDGNALTIVK